MMTRSEKKLKTAAPPDSEPAQGVDQPLRALRDEVADRFLDLVGRERSPRPSVLTSPQLFRISALPSSTPSACSRIA